MRKLFTNSTVLAVAIAAIAITAVWAARTFDQITVTGLANKPGIITNQISVTGRANKPAIMANGLVSGRVYSVTKTANFEIKPTRDGADAPGTTYKMAGLSAITATLPAPSAANVGYWYRFRNVTDKGHLLNGGGANLAILNNNSATNYVIGKLGYYLNAECLAWSDGVKWHVENLSPRGVDVTTIQTKDASFEISPATVTNDAPGAIYNVDANDAVVVTLPNPVGIAGYEYKIASVCDQDLKITCAVTDVFVTPNSTDSDYVEFKTSSEKIGAAVRVWSDGNLWHIEPLCDVSPDGGNTWTVTDTDPE